MLDLGQLEEEWYRLDDYHSQSGWASEYIPKLIEEVERLRLQLEFAKIDAGCAEGIGYEKGYAAAKHDIEDRSHS